MSTRANIVIKDNYDKLFFYRHSDGYPEGAMPTLSLFLNWLKNGKIRNNVGQAAGWLVVIGAIEYDTLPKWKTEKGLVRSYGQIDSIAAPADWKASSYEPTTGVHGDIQYLYIIDLNDKTINCYEEWTDEGEGKGTPVSIEALIK